MKSKIVKENNYTIFYLQYSEFGVLTYYKHALQRNRIYQFLWNLIVSVLPIFLGTIYVLVVIWIYWVVRLHRQVKIFCVGQLISKIIISGTDNRVCQCRFKWRRHPLKSMIQFIKVFCFMEMSFALTNL